MAKANDTATKEAKKAAKLARKKASKERRTQLWQAFQMQRKEDQRLIPYMVGVVAIAVAIAVEKHAIVGRDFLALVVVA